MDQSSTGVEKASAMLAEDTAHSHVSSDNRASESAGFDEVTVKRLIRKIDLKLLPLLTVLYLLSFLDRTNIGNARLDTLEADLGMSGLMHNNVSDPDVLSSFTWSATLDAWRRNRSSLAQDRYLDRPSELDITDAWPAPEPPAIVCRDVKTQRRDS